jgi:quercetin dioxygenase-like cupin family protein
MNPRNNRQFILAICISLIIVACGGGDKKADDTKAADSTSAAKADTVKPASQDASVDAVKAAPDLYKTISDTLGIRIVEATYKPGDSSAMHSHPDYALYVIEGGTAQFTGKDGTKFVNEMKTGMENIRPSEFHSVKNVGKTTVKVLLVEVSRPKATASADAPLDATKVAAKEYKLIKDTLGIRVVEATYKPGESSVMHSHPDIAMYAISGGTSEFTDKDGKKIVSELKPGLTRIVPATTHSVKNIGKTTSKVLLVEVNRPLK